MNAASSVDAGPAVVMPSDRAVADLCLAADGLLTQTAPVGETVRPPSPNALRRVGIQVDRGSAEAAVRNGRLVVADAESVPVVELTELTTDRAASPDQLIVTGVASPAAGVATGVGQELRVTRRPRPTVGATVVVLERPLLIADEARLAGGSVVLAVPIAGPSPDGIPAPVMLRLARRSAGRLGADLVAVTLDWRDARSDAALAAHVAAGLGAARLVHLRSARTDSQQPWAQLMRALQDGSTPPADLADSQTIEELRRWRPDKAHRGLVVFFTGLSGAGKSTIARLLAEHLLAGGQRSVSMLDGDEVRRLLSAGLGFGAQGRDQNVRRIGYVATEVARHGGVAICAPIAPYEHSRQAVRRMVEQVGDLVLVHVATSLAECEARDVKGLYARARAGQIAEFTGISDPYEVPLEAELRLETAGRTPQESLDEILDHLRAGGWLPTES